MEEIYLIAIINQSPFVAILLNYYFVLVQIFSVTGLLKEYLLVCFLLHKTKSNQSLSIFDDFDFNRNETIILKHILYVPNVSLFHIFRQLHNYS